MSVILVVIVPLIMAAILVTLWNRPKGRKMIALAGAIAHAITGIFLLFQVLQQGTVGKNISGWQAPFGIEFSADLFSAILCCVATLIGLSVTVFAHSNIDDERTAFGFYPLFFVLMAGISGAFVTADLFNMFVWFECILLSSFVLLSLGGEKIQIRGALNYVLPNLFSSMLFLAGLGLLYGATGTLNMAQLAERTAAIDPATRNVIAVIFLTAFGVKAALFPFFSWLPNSYHTPPTSIGALFAGLLTKVGIYAIIRFFATISPTAIGPLIDILQAVCLLTIVIGTLGALAHHDLKKILGYLLIGHIAFMLLGLIVQTPEAMAASFFYMVNHILVITCLYFFAGIIAWNYGTCDLRKLGRVQACDPKLIWGFAIPTLSLIGIPPFSGFWPKLGLLQSTAHPSPILFAAILISSFLTLIVMARVWAALFWKPAPENAVAISRCPLTKAVPTYLLALTILFISIYPAPFADLAKQATDQTTIKFRTFYSLAGEDK